ncbi:MAG TPA: sulfatase-like hydrolase/transferase, partial [Polyangiaceae bacterium]|nr:sulfatase-like hydrolase/transferase [Polyangiaceae bacterium]
MKTVETSGTRGNPAAAVRIGWKFAQPTLVFIGVWLLLDVMVNLRYPGPEPAFWYFIPSVDVLVIFLYLALFGSLRKSVPLAVRVGVVAWLFLVRLIRLGDGIQEQYYSQPFNLYADLPLVPELLRFAAATLSWWKLILAALFVTLALAALSVALYRALVYAERYLADGRHVVVFGVVSVVSLAALSLAPRQPEYAKLYWAGFAASATPRLRHELSFLFNVYSERASQARAMAEVERKLEHTPSDLFKLHHANVYLFLVESYGQTVFERKLFTDASRSTFDAFESELGQKGFSIVSGLLDSPTYGGRSWLAHATLSTGMQTTNQLEYELVCTKKPKPIARFFRDAGYRTVLVQPGTTRPWPKGEFYDFEQKYYAYNFDYAGPPYAWSTMPDQYVVDFVRRRELDSRTRPLFIEYVLVTSHAPWSDQPQLVE